MSSRKAGDFEFRLGKFGLVLFTIGVSLLLLFSFIFGVIVGKNIESYPEMIARDIPNKIKEKIIKGKDVSPDKKEKDEFKLTFYDTLTSKSKEAGKHVYEKEKYIYTIQVASFKDKIKTEALCSRLRKMKLSPRIDKTELASSGEWFRVKIEGFTSYDEAKKTSQSLEKRIKGLKCLIIKNKK